MNINFRSSYWRVSRQLSVGLILAAPLWVLYEVLAYRLNNGLGGQLRTGVDHIFVTGLEKLSLPLEATYVVPALLILAIFSRKDPRAEVGDCKRHFWPLMCVECLVYAAVFGIVVSNMSDLFLQGGGALVRTKWTYLVINLGSGLYEELVFRLGILSGMMLILERYLSNRWFVFGISIATSALSFAMFHYLDLFDEQFAWPSFIFRLLAGVIFSIIFLVRGYGVAACTHSCYNLLLLFR